MSGFCKVTFNGEVVKCGGSEKWGWALVEWQDPDNKYPTKMLFGGPGDIGQKLASYKAGSPITGTAGVRRGKNKETGEYETSFIVRELTGSGVADDIGF